mgnify:CR=1 FL=1
MKHDINLLQKKKPTQYSGKKLGIALLVVLLLGGLLFAGIQLPERALKDAQIRLADLNQQIANQTAIEQQLTEKTQKNAMLQQQLVQLEVLSVTRQDVARYVKAVEASLPTSATVTHLSLEGNRMTVNGIVQRADALATFALRLRETQAFASVFVTSSVTPEPNAPTSFVVTALLPTPLSDEAGVTGGSDIPGQPDDRPDQSQGGSNEDDGALIADGDANTVAAADSATSGEANQ